MCLESVDRSSTMIMCIVMSKGILTRREYYKRKLMYRIGCLTLIVSFRVVFTHMKRRRLLQDSIHNFTATYIKSEHLAGRVHKCMTFMTYFDPAICTMGKETWSIGQCYILPFLKWPIPSLFAWSMSVFFKFLCDIKMLFAFFLW